MKLAFWGNHPQYLPVLQDTLLQSDQLQKDKEELLRQVVTLREQLESCSGESKTLKSKVRVSSPDQSGNGTS